MPRKTQGWEKRLADYIESVKDKPFERGVHDCATFAGHCVNVMTGDDTTSEFKGPYKTKKEAYEFLKKIGYEGLAAIPNKLLGPPLPSPAYAGRGDGVLIVVDGEEALGIIDLSGRRAASVDLNGLRFYEMKYVVTAWKV